ncbi:transposase [Mycobacterium marinum]|uniref:ATP-binding protein n=1 Tax=Mycobacterium marinum TaxID=1781 RepID=UPI000ECA4CE5|nr:ATP-binding protein [Mycobacterium marinum]RFZ62992.1 transposase [Mycobacterium marinum]
MRPAAETTAQRPDAPATPASTRPCGWIPGTTPRPHAYDRTLWTDLTSLRFLDGPHGALLLGPVGVGKTHLATTLGRIPTLMLRADSMFKQLRASRLDNSTEAEMRRLGQIRLLIIEDFALQPMDATATADFYELVVARHQRASTVLTSNRSPDEWLAIMTDPLLAQSAVDRLTSTAHELVIVRPVLPTPPEALS